jgi:hypothetical protein
MTVLTDEKMREMGVEGGGGQFQRKQKRMAFFTFTFYGV